MKQATNKVSEDLPLFINYKSIKMKRIFIILLMLPTVIFSQYATVDFISLNEGTDEDYHKLEQVWKVYHQNSIDADEKTGWSV